VATHEEPYSERQRHEVNRLKVVTRIRRMWLTWPSNFRLVLLSPLEPFSAHRINEWQLHKIAERREDVDADLERCRTEVEQCGADLDGEQRCGVVRQTGDGGIYESLCGWTLLLRPNSVTAG